MPDEERQPLQVAIGSYIAQAFGDGAKAVVNVFQGGTDEARELRNRRRMLQLVWNTWIEGVLKQSLYNEVLIELGMETKPDAVEHPWDMVIQMPGRESEVVPPGTTMLELFEMANRSLLITGEPGSGKTTMLLELCRLLIEQAEENIVHQIPVIFNLSTWKPELNMKPEETFAGWLVNELHERYFIPHKIGRRWIENNALILMLDGLDEVRDEHRRTCVQSINAFQSEHGLQLAACSRIQEYRTLEFPLKLHSAVQICPLSKQQLNEYWEIIGDDFTGVYQVVQKDPELQEFIQTPLILSILMLAYHNITEAELKRIQDAKDSRMYLFDVYIAQMFKRRIPTQRYTAENTKKWLSWIAREMVDCRQTLFKIEDIQPNWLPYSIGRQNLIFQLIVGLIMGLSSGSIFWWFGGLMTGNSNYRLIIGLFGGLITGLVAGQSYTKPTDKLSWKWKHAMIGLFIGLVLGLIVGEIIAWVFVGWFKEGVNPRIPEALGFNLVLPFMLLLGICSWLIFGFRSIPSDEPHTSGEGVRNSWKGFFIGLIGPFIGLLCGFVGGWSTHVLWVILIGPIYGLFIGLVAGLIFGLKFGGGFLIHHFITRGILYCNGLIPWDLISFLDYCKERIFLRAVGGGYIFIHRMLLEHFAALYDEQFAKEKA